MHITTNPVDQQNVAASSTEQRQEPMVVVTQSSSKPINLEQPRVNQERTFIVNGVNMLFWYPEAFLEPLLEKYLAQGKLHTTSRAKGIVLQENNEVLKLGVDQDQFTISLSQPIVVGTTTSARDSLYDSLHHNVKEIFTWNQQVASQPEPIVSQLIHKHILLCPINLGNMHWALLCITVKVLRNEGIFYPASDVDIKIYDTKSILGKYNKNLQDQLNDILTSLIPESLRTNITFNVTVPKIRQQPATDAHACGVLVTEMARCFISNNGQIPELKVADSDDYTLNEILQIRTEHLQLLGDPRFNDMQHQQVVYRFENKQTEWNDFALRKAIYELVQALPQKDQEEFYQLINQIIIAEKISFDHLSRDNYAPLSEHIRFFTGEYQSEYLEHISNLKVPFEDINHAKFYLCVSYAQKKCGEKVQTWFGKYYSQLQPYLDEIFLPEQVTAYKDNGIDKLMEVWRDLLQCKSNNSPPAERKGITTLFNSRINRVISEDEYFNFDADKTEIADHIATRLPFILKFIGNTYPTGKPKNGHISCQIGPAFSSDCLVYYTGTIKDGTTNGSGIMHAFSPTQGIIAFVSGIFWKGGFQVKHSDENNTALIEVLRKHLTRHEMDLRLPEEDKQQYQLSKPIVEQYARLQSGLNTHLTPAPLPQPSEIVRHVGLDLLNFI